MEWGLDSGLWIAPVAALVLGYLLGSIPFGLILTRITGAGDLRTIGSGNIGATNVLRTGRKGIAALTLLFDTGKGTAAVLIGEAIAPGSSLLGAAGAFLGHLYPVWIGFRGGKGVATLLGIAIGFSVLHATMLYAGIFALLWIGVTAMFRISSLGGMTASLALPVAAAAAGKFDLVVLFAAFAVLVLWKHRANIERLMAGTEPKIGQG